VGEATNLNRYIQTGISELAYAKGENWYIETGRHNQYKLVYLNRQASIGKLPSKTGNRNLRILRWNYLYFVLPEHISD
jgi:hypothetical protein